MCAVLKNPDMFAAYFVLCCFVMMLGCLFVREMLKISLFVVVCLCLFVCVRFLKMSSVFLVSFCMLLLILECVSLCVCDFEDSKFV